MKLIAANWKMNKTISEAVFSAKELKKLLKNESDNEIVICPPFTALHAVFEELKGSRIKLGAQNMHFMDSGAYTGEISPLMLKDVGAEYVILGHSERRGAFGEKDSLINQKVHAALNNGIFPILCVGEGLEDRNNGKAKEIIESQLGNCLKGVKENGMRKVSIAYEPLWAISKGNQNHKPATAKDAEEMHQSIKNFLKKIFDSDTAKNMKVIYGGSMKPDNAKELLSMPNIDGGLVGHASLDAKSFADVVKAAR